MQPALGSHHQSGCGTTRFPETAIQSRAEIFLLALDEIEPTWLVCAGKPVGLIHQLSDPVTVAQALVSLQTRFAQPLATVLADRFEELVTGDSLGGRPVQN